MAVFDEAWALLKALPEQQMFIHRKPKVRSLQSTSSDPLDHIDQDKYFNEGNEGTVQPVGTIHPAIRGLLARRALEEEEKSFAGFHRGRTPEDFENFEPHHDVYDYDEEMLKPNLEVPRHSGEGTEPNFDIQNRPFASHAHIDTPAFPFQLDERRLSPPPGSAQAKLDEEHRRKQEERFANWFNRKPRFEGEGRA